VTVDTENDVTPVVVQLLPPGKPVVLAFSLKRMYVQETQNTDRERPNSFLQWPVRLWCKRKAITITVCT